MSRKLFPYGGINRPAFPIGMFHLPRFKKSEKCTRTGIRGRTELQAPRLQMTLPRTLLNSGAVDGIMTLARASAFVTREASLSDIEPIVFRPRQSAGRGFASALSGTSANPGANAPAPQITRFDRLELTAILNLYGRMVAGGEWRDYAMDFLKDKAVFSVYRRTSEYPLYRIEKTPKLARKQGAYSVVTVTGLVLKRGPDLKRVLAVLERKLEAVDS